MLRFFLGILFLVACPMAAFSLPGFSHVVVVIEENSSFNDIIGNSDASFINLVAGEGALFTQAYGVEHPSQPNYLDLFSGGNQGVINDSCPHTITAPNLATSLFSAGRSFGGYSEGLRRVGFLGCGAGDYKRKHNPWANFTNVPASANMPIGSFPERFENLPSVSFVVPDQKHDMHDGTVKQADDWLRDHIAAYLSWAVDHDSLLIIVWDESDSAEENHIPLIVAGAHVKQGKYDQYVNHFSVLRTLLDIFDLTPIGASASAKPLTALWDEPSTAP